MSLTPRQRIATVGVIVVGLGTAAAALAGSMNLAGAGVALLLTSAVVGLIDVRRRQGDLAGRLTRLATSQQRATARLVSRLDTVAERGNSTARQLRSQHLLLKQASSQAAAVDKRVGAVPGSVEKLIARQLRQHTSHVEGLLQIYGGEGHADAMPLSGGWAIDAVNLSAMLTVIERRQPQVVLECGSGTSTAWTGRLLRSMNEGRVISLDHSPEYADATLTAVDLLGVRDRVEVRLVDLVPPAIENHQTPWYDVSALDDIAVIDVILVDGPPERTGHLARYPVVPLLFDRMSDDAVIMIDDATRPDEAEMIDRWKREFPSLHEEVPVPRSTLRILRKISGTTVDTNA